MNTVLVDLEKSGQAATLFDKYLGSESQYKFKRSFTFEQPAQDPILNPEG